MCLLSVCFTDLRKGVFHEESTFDPSTCGRARPDGGRGALARGSALAWRRIFPGDRWRTAGGSGDRRYCVERLRLRSGLRVLRPRLRVLCGGYAPAYYGGGYAPAYYG